MGQSENVTATKDQVYPNLGLQRGERRPEDATSLANVERIYFGSAATDAGETQTLVGWCCHSRACLPSHSLRGSRGSILPQAPELAERWMVGTSPTMTTSEGGLAVRSRVASASCLAATAVAAMLGFSDMVSAQQPALGRQMLEAATRGDATTVRKLIGAGAPLDPVDASKRTPLLIAVERDELETATLLIEAGANINAQAANLDTPWLLAGARGRAEMLRLMIAKKPDLSLRNRFGGNALIPACEHAHVEAVEVLLTTQIDVNHINNLGWTCLLEIVILGDRGPKARRGGKVGPGGRRQYQHRRGLHLRVVASSSSKSSKRSSKPTSSKAPPARSQDSWRWKQIRPPELSDRCKQIKSAVESRALGHGHHALGGKEADDPGGLARSAARSACAGGRPRSTRAYCRHGTARRGSIT